MKNSPYHPIFEFTRGEIIESVHFGAVAVVAADGSLLAYYGDPNAVTYLRSSAKPFQALPFFQNQGPELYRLNSSECAIICASHSGTDEHVDTIRSIHHKVGIDELELMCGTHKPYDEPTAERMRDNREAITPNRHNCSGKHSGMLAYERLLIQKGRRMPDNLAYIDLNHPIQTDILRVFASICDLTIDQIAVGIDGCSAPNFAVPLYNAALAYARLCAPDRWGNSSPDLQNACSRIFEAMTTSPEMVAGPGRFDTQLMQVANGRILSKGGAEGFQGIGLASGTLSGCPTGVGIAVKIADGDDRSQVRAAVSLDVLRQLGVLSDAELNQIKDRGPRYTLLNARGITVGYGYPSFLLERP